jgi:signal transduction histidine kinase
MTEAALAPGASALPARPVARAARRMPLAVKLAAALIGLVVLVLLVNGAVNMWLSYGQAKTAAIQVQQEKALAAAERVGQFVTEIENQIGWTTRVEWSRIPLEQQRYDFIRLLRQVPAITELSYIDGKGKEQLKVSRLEPDSVGSGRDFSSDPRFAKAVADKAWFGPVYFRRGSEPYITIAVAHAGREPGVTVAEVNLKLIWDVITAIRVGEKGYAYVVDGKGRLIAHPDLSLVLRDTDLSHLPQVKMALAEASAGAPRGAAQPDMQKAGAAEIVTSMDGASVLTAHAAVPRLGWIVFVQLPLAEALAPVYASLIQTLALLGLGLLLALIIGGLLARRMVVPIRHLQQGAERLGGGDLAQRIDIRTGDEIETLADRFNQMASKVQESHETLEAKVEERTHDLNEALEYQTATSDVLKVISRSPDDLQPVLDAIVETSRRLCGTDNAALFLLSDGAYRIKADSGTDPAIQDYLRKHPITLDQKGSSTARAAREKRIIHVPDTGSDPEFGQGILSVGGRRALLSVPLMRDGNAVGVITTQQSHLVPFGQRQIDLVQTFADQAVIAIENARLFEEVQAKTRDLTESLERQGASADILRVISGSPTDTKPVFEAIVLTATKLFGCNRAGVFLVDGKNLKRVTGARSGHLDLEHERGPQLAIDAAANFPSRAVVEKKTVFIPDFSAIDLPEHEKLVRERFGVESALLLPLLREGECVGVLFLTASKTGVFGEKEIALAESFRDQTMIAIENTRLFKETQEALDQQTATADVLKVISRSALDLKSVLTTLTQSAVGLCSAIFGVVFQRDGDLLRVQAQSGCPPELYEHLVANPIRGTDRGSFSGRVFMSGEIVHLPDVLADPEFTFHSAANIGHFRAALGVPLKIEGRVEGVFGLVRHEPGPFTTRQIELVQTFADQAVIAIDNARLFEQVQARTRELTQSLAELRAAQDRLIQSEKLASLGQLTAGIAHEIKNPLNFVNNFAALSGELISELGELLETAKLDDKLREEIEELTGMLQGNLEKVVQHGKRADSIVKNMLLHSRESAGEHRPIDLNAVVEESVNLAYHGARAEKPGFNITLVKHLDPAVGEVDLYPQEFQRVLLNLISNGFYAATKRKAQSDGVPFEPTLTASTKNLGDKVEIKIRDNGTGIPDEVKAKMFNPFFTTKPAGEGTGLGLSLSYDIVVKQHGGTIDVDTKPGDFTEFTIVLPRAGNPAPSQRA